MNPYEIWFALFAFFGIAVVAPAWMYFVQTYFTTTPSVQFLATAFLPITGLLLVASWLQPGGA